MVCSVGGAIGREISLDFRRRTGGATVVATKEECDGSGVRRRRRAALRMVDRQLAKGNFKLALSLVKQLQRQPPPAGGLRGFAAAKQVPRRVSSVEDLHLSVTETSALQSLFDSILDLIMSSLESSPSEEASLLGQGHSVTSEGNGLYLEDDIVDHNQVAQHEAGHFLVGYLLGVLPKKYGLFSTEDMKQDNILDASVKFIGFEFLTELEDAVPSKKLQQVKPGHRLIIALYKYISNTPTPFHNACMQASKGKLSSTVLSKLLCVILGGLVAEHLVFGYSKGHHADVEMLERVLNQFTQDEDEANTLIRWCVLNTLVVLHRHGEATSMLAEAMAHGRSIGNCIDIIEITLQNYQHI
ncbi:hypothetical protein OSB04_001039 [Centaurea solstitialis]|uniref:Uncharacterized protein n=1 Tax=Centaurea solstitialis TaxID=347529 RepID=A0AA38U9H8_9ASTR|nr:hypothetical protein OSB04_001039 [Centaurea solstitialis]